MLGSNSLQYIFIQTYYFIYSYLFKDHFRLPIYLLLPILFINFQGFSFQGCHITSYNSKHQFCDINERQSMLERPGCRLILFTHIHTHTFTNPISVHVDTFMIMIHILNFLPPTKNNISNESYILTCHIWLFSKAKLLFNTCDENGCYKINNILN